MDTQTQPVDPEVGERFTVDTSYTKEPAYEPEQKPRPTPGRYYLQAGIVTARANPARSGESEFGPWSFPANVTALPDLSILSDADGSDEHAGKPVNKYYRLNTDRVVLFKNPQNYSTLSSALEAFGLSLPESGDSEDIKTAATNMSGLRSLWPIYLTLRGQYQNERGKYKDFAPINGKRLYFNEKAFRLGEDTKSRADVYKAEGGKWAARGFLLDPHNDETRAWTLTKPSENVVYQEVWANLEPTDDGFKPPKG